MAFTKLKELLAAANTNDLATIKILCSMPVDEAPAEPDIKAALKESAQAGSLEAVEYLCLSAAASQTDVSEALIVICKLDEKKTSSNKWKLISTLCAITAENKPTQDAINIALSAFIRAGEWDFIKTLCETNNPPSQKAIGSLLKIASINNLPSMNRTRPLKDTELPYDLMTHLFETSITKPSKEDVSATLISICKYKDLDYSKSWDFITYLCALAGENKPNQDAINQALIISVSSKKRDLVQKICSIDGDNAPGQKVIADILIESAGFNNNKDLEFYVSLDLIKLLCETSVNKPTQTDINAVVDAALKSSPIKSDYLKYFCSLKTANKPNQVTIDKVLAAAAKFDWVLVKTLCESDNPPSQKAVGNLLKIASVNNPPSMNRNLSLKNRTQPLRNTELPYDVMTHLFETSVTKPIQEDVSATLILICELQDLNNQKTWDFISYLCALTGENKPNQEAMNLVLRKAVSSDKSDFVKTLCLIDADNGPEKKVVADILIKGADIEPHVSLEIIKLLCETSTNKPTQADINTAVVAALKKSPIYLKYFCSLKTANKPNQDTIDKVLDAAAQTGDWSFVKALCEADNPPSQKALGNVLKQAGIRDLPSKSRNRSPINRELPYEVMTHLFETSITKPSREDVSATLILICKLQDMNAKKTWDFIFYLCALTEENKPNQEAMNLVLRKAVSSDKSDFVKTLCLIDADNGPEQKVVADILIKGADIEPHVSLEIIKLLCETSTNKPTQVDVNAAVDTALKKSPIKWDYLKYFCSLETANRPDQAAIDKVLAAAAKACDWPFVKALCEIDNPPSQKALGNVLNLAGIRDRQSRGINRPVKNTELPFDVMTHLFEISVIKPSKEDVSATLNLICLLKDLKDTKTWDYISYLCALTGENKPSTEAMNQVLRAAVLSDQSNFVKTLCLIDADNKPEQEVVAALLIESAGKNTNSYVSLKIIKLLCETSFNKPTQADVSVAVEAAWKTNKWAYITYFCSLTTDNRPTQDAIDNAFEAAATAGQWTQLKTLCMRDNPPGQKAIGYALKKAPLEIKKYLLETSITKPSQEDVGIILTAICRSKNNWANSEKLEFISYLCALTAEFKPSQPVIKLVLIAAVLNNNLDLVKKIAVMETDNAPDRDAIELALAKANNLEIIQCLCELERNAPGPEAIDKKLIAAASSQSIEQVKYLCETKTPGQEAIDEALIQVLASPDDFIEFSLEIVRYLCESKTKTPGQNAINATIIAAASFQCFEIVKYLCELEKHILDQDAIEEALLEAAPYGTLETFQYLFEKLDSTRQEKVRDLALQRTNDNEITFYLNEKAPETKCEEKETTPVTETKEARSSSIEFLSTQNSSQNEMVPLLASKTETNKPDGIFTSSQTTLFAKPKNLNESKPPRKSCFSDSQIEAINARITELEGEMEGCCFSFFVNTDRKKEKILGLTELLRIGLESEMTVARAIAQISNDARFPELLAGTVYNRTGELLDDILASSKMILSN
jgi:hypothetical protein